MRVNAEARTLAAAVIPQQSLVRNVLLVVGASAFVALCAQIRIHLPFTPVPITGQTFAVLLVGALLGSRLGGASLLAYLLEGAAGLPVFAGATGGWGVISGPTGGYIVGFVLAAYSVGWLAERGWDRWPWTTALAMLAGSVLVYACGLPWLARFVPGDQVFALGLLPFIPGDTVKLLLAASLVPSGWMAIQALSPRGLASIQPPIGLSSVLDVPWRALYLMTGIGVVAGSLLPWGTDTRTGETVTGIAAGEGVITLAMGMAILVGAMLPWSSLAGRAATSARVLWLFAASTVAAFVAFYDIIHAITTADFWLGNIGWGLAVLAASATAAFLAVVTEGSTPAEPAA